MAFTDMSEYLLKVLSNSLLNERTNMRVKLIPRALEEQGCIQSIRKTLKSKKCWNKLPWLDIDIFI